MHRVYKIKRICSALSVMPCTTTPVCIEAELVLTLAQKVAGNVVIVFRASSATQKN